MERIYARGICTVELRSSIDNPRMLFVDVRSPGEYRHGRIPGAINIPLFNDTERQTVGTIYKQVGKEAAMRYGLAVFSQKLPQFVDDFAALTRDKNIVVYCWRGGMRSRTAVTMLMLADVRAAQLVGGYKCYRTHVLEQLKELNIQAEIVVLCGSTGSGKTDILHTLSARGLNVIDLEQLANHRGSAFGGVGLGATQSAQNFDALLLEQLRRFSLEKYIIVECESKRVGNVYIPDCLFAKMATGKKILLRTSIDCRAKRLVHEYTDRVAYEQSELESSLALLSSKIGKVTFEKLCGLLRSQCHEEFTKILLEKYYDPLYGYELSNVDDYVRTFDGDDLASATNAIEEMIGEYYG